MLEVRDLSTQFGPRARPVLALDRLSFSLEQGRTLCLVGESGCGKTTALLSLMALSGGRASGQILFEGQEVLTLSSRQLRQIRGNRMSLIFQEPQTALNPVLTVGTTLCHLISAHQALPRVAVRQQALALMARVGLPNPEALFHCYPHQLSGGMCQRVLIAGALANSPALVLADEPTSALDVTIRAQIIDLFAELKREQNCAFLIATHDLALVRRLADEVLVLYAGQLVEYGDPRQVFAAPRHPYTAALAAAGREEDCPPLGGEPPSPAAYPTGCRFHPRCPKAGVLCSRQEPPLISRGPDGGTVRCFYPE